MTQIHLESEYDVPVPGIFHFFGGIGTGIGTNWYRKKVSEPVLEKFGTEKSTGIGIENIWCQKKVSVSVSFNILGTVTHWLQRMQILMKIILTF